jgi:hypothetical protein
MLFMVNGGMGMRHGSLKEAHRERTYSRYGRKRLH